MGALTTATRVPTWHRAGGGHHNSVMLCPQVPLFIFCKTDNHGPQELPAGPMDHPWAEVRGQHGPNRVKSGVTILEIPSHSAKNRAKCGAQRERRQTPISSGQHHSGRWRAGLGGAGAGTMQAVTSGGARACSRTRGPRGAVPPSAATTGALRVQDARGRGRLQHLTRGGRLSLCTALGELPLAACR